MTYYESVYIVRPIPSTWYKQIIKDAWTNQNAVGYSQGARLHPNQPEYVVTVTQTSHVIFLLHQRGEKNGELYACITLMQGPDRLLHIPTSLMVADSGNFTNSTIITLDVPDLAPGQYLAIPYVYQTLGETRGFVSPVINPSVTTTVTSLDEVNFTFATYADHPVTVTN